MNTIYKLLNEHERPASWLARKIRTSPARMTKISKMTDEELADYLTVFEVYEIDEYLPGFLEVIQTEINS